MRWGKSDHPAPVAVGARIATLLAAQTATAPTEAVAAGAVQPDVEAADVVAGGVVAGGVVAGGVVAADVVAGGVGAGGVGATEAVDAGTAPGASEVVSRSWTLTEHVASTGTTYRVSAAVVTAAAGMPAADADAGRLDVSAADPTLSYRELVRYREALAGAGFLVEDVLEGWRTVALDVTGAPAQAPTAPAGKRRGDRTPAVPAAPVE
ncbi:hypothetical protein MXD58_011640, partial [Frankia sp. AgKG'84/4]